MKTKIIIVVSTICLLKLGCRSNRESFLEEYITVSDEVVRIVNANPTAEGVKQAQDYLDSKKASLKSKFEAGSKECPDKDMEDKFRVIIPAKLRAVSGLSDKHDNIKDPLDKLTEDFGTFLLKS